MTVWVAVAEFPDASVAVHVIVVVPIGYGSLSGNGPSLREPETVTKPELSVAVAVPGSTVAVARPGSVETDTFAGACTTGGSVSRTVTVCVAVAVLPAASVAVQVIVVVPVG